MAQPPPSLLGCSVAVSATSHGLAMNEPRGFAMVWCVGAHREGARVLSFCFARCLVFFCTTFSKMLSLALQMMSKSQSAIQVLLLLLLLLHSIRYATAASF